jgi:hypothetical protein
VGFVVDKVASGQVFSEYFGFPCHSFHQIIHPHNHPGQVQLASEWPTCLVDPVWTQPPTMQIKKKILGCTLIWRTRFSLLLVGFLLACLFNPEDRSDIFLWNVGLLLLGLHRSQNSSLLERLYHRDVTLVNCTYEACNWPVMPPLWPADAHRILHVIA